MARFEKVSRFVDADFVMPARKTLYAAGYDMVVAEDIVLPSITNALMDFYDDNFRDTLSLDGISKFLKEYDIFKPTLVSSGVKCQLEKNEYLELSVRSSTPLKYGIIMANSEGIIDADYYNNKSNEGEIFFQLYNLTPFDIQLHRGDCLCQGIIKNYQTTTDDNQVKKAVRDGGLGSTNPFYNSICTSSYPLTQNITSCHKNELKKVLENNSIETPDWVFINKENPNG